MGETLVNEEVLGRVARLVGVPRHVVIAALGATMRAASGSELFAQLGVERPDAVDAVVYGRRELYPGRDCLPGAPEGRRLPRRESPATRPRRSSAGSRDEQLPVDVIGSSAVGESRSRRPRSSRGWSTRRLRAGRGRVRRRPRGQRCRPAAEAGLVAVHVRRGPWGYSRRGAERARSGSTRSPSSGGARRCLSPGSPGKRGAGGSDRVGIDAHAFADGVPLVLGGVRFDEHPRGLAGHSDGDVLAHALTDAVLGAAGLGDIGSLFPSDDERWRGADSLELLRDAWTGCARPAGCSSTPTAS